MSTGLVIVAGVVARACPLHMWWARRRGRRAACCPPADRTPDAATLEARKRALAAELRRRAEVAGTTASAVPTDRPLG